MYKQSFLTGILGTLLISACPALAQSIDHQFRDQKHQVHDAAKAGVISPQQHQVLDSQRNMQHAAVDNGYVAPGAYPNSNTVFPAYGNYTNQGYGGGHVNNPAINPGHNNSIGHRMGDALNGNQAMNPALYQQNGLGQGGLPGQGYSGGHINDPNYNPGHNNSLGHQMKDAINPGVAPAYGAPGAVSVYGNGGFQGAPVGANHVNNPYINPGHNGSVQHQLNDAVNAGQVLPGQVPVINRRQHGHGYGQDDHGH